MNHLISRLAKPLSSQSAKLYCKGNELVGTNSGRTMRQGEKLSFDTYFNACFETFYARYTSLRSLRYRLRCRGRFRVSLVRTHGDGHREPVSALEVVVDDGTEDVYIDLPELDAAGSSRLFLELESLLDGGEWLEGAMITDQEPTRKVSLGVITCTYHKESYVKRTVSSLLDDVQLKEKRFQVLVVDNGRTLSDADFPDQRVRLIPNRNLGGSGGFNRGLIEAMYSEEHTHFLFMDDDIVVDSAVIHRLITLFEYARTDVAVCGAMFDLLREPVLFEAGAQYMPLLSTPLKHDLDLGLSGNLDKLLDIEPIDYGGFWFFGFSRELVDRIGFPLPFFIKVDDMEYGLRIAADPAAELVAFPGIGVWHEPFYAKTPIWDIYYYTRNNLVANSVHKRSSLLAVLAGLTRRVVGRVMLFDYSSARMLLRGLADFLKGPEFLRGLDSESFHQEILAQSKSYAQTRKPMAPISDLPAEWDGTKDRRAWPMRLLAVMTLNGHLLPYGLLRDREPYLSDDSEAWAWVFGGRSVVFVNRNAGAYRNQMDRAAGLGILREWLGLLGWAGGRGGRVSRQWEQAFEELKSADFLCGYYGFEPAQRPRDRSTQSQQLME